MARPLRSPGRVYHGVRHARHTRRHSRVRSRDALFFLDYGTLDTGFEPVAFHVAREDDISW